MPVGQSYANPGEFDERDELMQRLIFGKLAGRLAAGKIVRTVLNCDPQCSARHCGCDALREELDEIIGQGASSALSLNLRIISIRALMIGWHGSGGELKVEEKPMTDKSNFTPDEWKLILESVMMAGIAVSAAEPSGLWGLLKESFAGGTALVTAKMDSGSNPLIKAVVADFESADGRSIARDGVKEQLTGSKAGEIKAKCIETLRQAGAVVDTKAPGDAAAFKGWLRQISQHVAEAATEGGFLGIGGVPVSEGEKATLTEISSALRLSA